MVAERRDRIPMEMVRSVMAYADLTLSFRTEVVNIASYILNKVVIIARKLTTFDYWTGHRPDLSNYMYVDVKYMY